MFAIAIALSYASLPMAKQALGKGLDALIKGNPAAAPPAAGASHVLAASDPASGERVKHVHLSVVTPSPLQPRKHFNDEQLEELVDSIREHGVIQPLIVREVDTKLELIAGERRWRAAKKLDLDEVPVIIRVASDREVLEIALIENLQREDLNPIEEAEAYVRLARDFQMRQEDIAQRVGKNRATIANSMRLLDLHSEVQDLVSGQLLSVGHAKAILGIKDQESQRLIAQGVVKKNLTVRATEKLVSDQLMPSRKIARSKTQGGQVSSAVKHLEEKLQAHFSTKVRLHHGEKKGRIEILYYGNDDLDRVLDVMGVKRD